MKQSCLSLATSIPTRIIKNQNLSKRLDVGFHKTLWTESSCEINRLAVYDLLSVKHEELWSESPISHILEGIKINPQHLLNCITSLERDANNYYFDYTRKFLWKQLLNPPRRLLNRCRGSRE